MRATEVVLGACIVVWACVLALCIIGIAPFAQNGLGLSGSETFWSALFYGGTLLDGVLVLLIFIGALRGAHETARTGSPFTESQALRLKRIALALLAYGIVDSFFSARFTSMVYMGFCDLTQNSSAGIAFDRPWFIPEVNIGALVAAAVVFCVAVAFEYGRELQNDSDAFI